MYELPVSLDVSQLRRQAKELRVLVLAGDRVACDRIQRAHPGFGGVGVADADLASFTLSDAQLCVARELGFDGWRSVLAHAQGKTGVERPLRRWPDHPDPTFELFKRAERVSREAGHRHVGPEHALGALLRGGRPTVSCAVLEEAGITWALWIARHRVDGVVERGRSFNPAWYWLVGMAEGIALADASEEVSDEHVLLALAYHRSGTVRDCLVECGADPDAIVAALGCRGVAVSELRPPAAAPEPAPAGPRVYVPEGEFASLRRELYTQFPPGHGNWSWNTDGEGRCWVSGDAELHLEEVVRNFVSDPACINVQPINEALKEDHRRWYGLD